MFKPGCVIVEIKSSPYFRRGCTFPVWFHCGFAQRMMLFASTMLRAFLKGQVFSSSRATLASSKKLGFSISRVALAEWKGHG